MQVCEDARLNIFQDPGQRARAFLKITSAVPDRVLPYTDSSKIVYNIHHMKFKPRLFCVFFMLTAFSGCAQVEDTTLFVPGSNDQITLMARAVPMERGMLLIWVNPNSYNTSWFNVYWNRSIDSVAGVFNKTDETGARVRASHVFDDLMDETTHRFLVHSVIPGLGPILVLDLNATTGVNHDNDSEPDFLDPDDDNDGIPDTEDILCQFGVTGWTSTAATDYDGDGCRDSDEDDDDDNDNVSDADDRCATNATGWTSNSITDYDGDGCRDSDEDPDDDNDGKADTEDACRRSPATDASTAVTPRGCLPVPAGGLNTRAVPLQEGMRLEWTNPSAAQIPGNIAGFNVAWRRLSDNATGMENKTDETDAAVDASYELANLTDEREHQFLVYAVIPAEDPILVLKSDRNDRSKLRQ